MGGGDEWPLAVDPASLDDPSGELGAEEPGRGRPARTESTRVSSKVQRHPDRRQGQSRQSNVDF